ncbi:DMT family transporter [Paracoccaceae bacterium GXU_MW_L88]
MQRNSPLAGILVALCGFAVFATHDAIIKHLGASYSVFQIIFFAGLFALIPMTFIMGADRREDTFRPNNPLWVAGRVVSGLIAMASAFYAFSVLPMTEVYAILFTTPLLVTALSVPILGETVGKWRWMAVVMGLIGVVVVLRPGSSDLTFGHATALIGALANAFSALITRKIGPQERPVVMVLFPMLGTLIVMACLQPAVYQPPTLTALALMAVVGLFSVTGQLASVFAYSRAPAAMIAPLQYSQIIWATIFGLLFFDETPDKWVAIGTAIIIASGLFALFRERVGISRVKPVSQSRNMRSFSGPAFFRYNRDK